MIPGINVNRKGLGVVSVIVVALVYLLYSQNYSQVYTPSESMKVAQQDAPGGSQGEQNPAGDGEEEDTGIGKNVIYTADFVRMNGFNVYVQTARSISKENKVKNITILLLHGMAFSSQNWKAIGTLQQLALAGFNPIAIDLPNNKNGQSTTEKENEKYDQPKFLEDFIAHEKIINPVIISPSYSGIFSIPYVYTNSDKVRAFVPIAPVIPSNMDKTLLKQSKMPVLALYGESDALGEEKSDQLINSNPLSAKEVVPNAGHPAYIDNTEYFHTKLLEFLNKL